MLRIALALVSGVALALSFEPVGFVVLLPLAVATFLWCVHGRSVRSGALLGLLFGVVFWHVLIFWMRVVGVDAWLALSLFMTLWFVVLGMSLAAVSRLPWWPLWSALVWVAIEVLRGAWPMSGFTWGRLAFATIDTPYAGWLPWVGTNGVTLLVALTGATLTWLVLRFQRARTSGRRGPARRTLAVLAGAAVLAVVLPGLVTWSGEDEGTARIAVVQGDVPGNGDNLLAHHREVTRSHMELTQDLAADIDAGRVERPDFVLWPENTTAVDPFGDVEIRTALRGVSEAVGVPILFGGIVDAPRPDEVLNQGIVFDAENGAGDRYTKRHPVPFGEYIPYRARFGTRNFGRLSLVPRDQLAGTRTTPLRVGDLEVADAICFDVAYDDAIGDQVRDGAQLLVVQTSNALFIHTGQIEQQFAISRVRALETGRSVVVAAVNGRSGFISADGSVAAGIEPRTRAVLVHEVPLVGGAPPSMWVGPWLGRAAVPVALGAVLWAVLPYRRRRRTPVTRDAGTVQEKDAVLTMDEAGKNA